MQSYTESMNGMIGEKGNPFKGISGWLIPVALSLILQPLMTLQWMNHDHIGDFFLDFSGMLHSPHEALLCLFDTAMLCLFAAALVLFFRRRRSVPQIMVIFCIGVIIRIGLYLYQVRDYEWLHSERPVWMALAFAAAAAIAYFFKSKRVAATFIR
jgi:hypothetical protein